MVEFSVSFRVIKFTLRALPGGLGAYASVRDLACSLNASILAEKSTQRLRAGHYQPAL